MHFEMLTRVARVSVVAHAACHEPRIGPPDKPRSQSEQRRHVPHPLHFGHALQRMLFNTLLPLLGGTKPLPRSGFGARATATA